MKPIYQRIAERLGATEPVNGTWIQAIANQYGITSTKTTWIQAIAMHLGENEPVNGSWITAMAKGMGVDVTITPTRGTYLEQVMEVPLAGANFTSDVTTVQQGTQVQFTDTSKGDGIISWAWDFGDGNTSTLQNPTHTYIAGGSYDVSLTIVDSNDTYTTTKVNYITVTLIPPVADFSVDNTTPTLATVVQFTDESTGDDITSWLWDFGDGNMSTLQNPTHTYSIEGTYDVSLTVTNSGGSDSKSKTVTVSSAPFIIKVDSGANSQFTIPTYTVGYTFNYGVKTSDGQTFTGLTGNNTITFPDANTDYIIEITGIFPNIYFVNGGDKLKLKEIIQFGDIKWGTMSSAYHGCSNMIMTATDAPDLSNMTTLWNTFRECSSMTTGSLNLWDTSTINNMGNTFNGATLFNQDISGWNVSSVANMVGMFENSSFNQDISGWDVSNVTNMDNMFYGATAFNQDLSSWCVSNFPSLPSDFDTGATSWTLPKPAWGTCPIISMTDLVAYYKLDGDGDDFYGNYDLTISNPDIIDDIDGKFDGGAYFPTDNINGATGNSTMSVNGNLDNLRMPFTVSMWVKPTPNLTFLFTINGESAEGGKGVSCYMAAAGQIVLEYHNGGPNGLPSRKTFATISGLLTPNVWSHVVIYVEDINTNKVYVNGNEINIQYSSGEATEVVWGDNSSIGSRLNYLGHQVSKDAYFDDVSIWNRELTENEVVKLYGDYPLDNSLISMNDLTAYYKLNGNMDDYTTNYDGTTSSASILDDIVGKFDGGAYFSPTNVDNGEYITLGNLGNLEEPFTVSGWYKSGGIDNVFLWSIGGDLTAGPTIGGYGVSSYVTSSGALVIEYRNGGATNAGGRLTHTSSVGVVPMDEWVHIAIYVDGIGSHKVYINGILTPAPYESGAAAFIAWGNECTIGCRIVVGVYQASKDLYMDDVSIWNRELTENEVIKLSGDSPLDNSTL